LYKEETTISIHQRENRRSRWAFSSYDEQPY
jgi:hypothetical protein